jgi:hypothetical protein
MELFLASQHAHKNPGNGQLIWRGWILFSFRHCNLSTKSWISFKRMKRLGSSGTIRMLQKKKLFPTATTRSITSESFSSFGRSAPIGPSLKAGSTLHPQLVPSSLNLLCWTTTRCLKKVGRWLHWCGRPLRKDLGWCYRIVISDSTTWMSWRICLWHCKKLAKDFMKCSTCGLPLSPITFPSCKCLSSSPTSHPRIFELARRQHLARWVTQRSTTVTQSSTRTFADFGKKAKKVDFRGVFTT